MGTTQRILPGVPGEPNWGNLSRAITQVAQTVQREDETETDSSFAEESETDQQDQQNSHAVKLIKLLNRRDNHIRSSYSNLIKTGGGKARIVSGKSKSIGGAGIKSSSKLAAFITDVAHVGLPATLKKLGFEVTGKNIQDVVDFLLVYSSDSSAGMDQTAANKASCEVLNEIAMTANNDVDEFERAIRTLATERGIADLVCRFFGHYIFEHLSQRFQEKITQEKGESISLETFKIIKEDILGQVARLNQQRPVSQIDWKGEEGKKEIEKIFKSILDILSDDN